MHEKDHPYNPTGPAGVDVAPRLSYLMGDTGGLRESMGGFRIEVYHTTAFPWAGVFKILLDHQFRVSVTRRKADVIIEALI
jgi:uncharacterized membrane protein